MGFLSLPTLALFVCVLVILLSLYFKRSIPMFLSMIFFVWQCIYVFTKSTPIIQYHLSLSVFVPLSFLLIGLQKEKGIFNKSGLAKLTISISILLLSLALAHLEPLLVSMVNPLFGIKFSFIKPVNDIFLFLFVLTLCMYLIKLIIEKNLKDIAFIVSFILSSVPFLFSNYLYNTPLFLAFGTGILGVMLVREAYKMAFIDTLTQIPSRRALEEYEKGLTPPFSLCMVDIDHFKKFNDTYGHDIGDEVLKYIAKELEKVGGGGKAFRYGGEEFTIIFANKFNHEAKKFLELTRENIAKKGFILRQKNRPNDKKGEKQRGKVNSKSKKVNLSVSMGLCDSGDAKYIYDMYILADKALYKAKKAGRNCLKIYK